jgi:DNA-binding LytR/AlgR family response regulator
VKTRTVIIDDEAGARDTLSRMVGRFLPTVDIVAEATDVRSGIHVLTEMRPDVVLLDIKMADGTGFDLLQQLPNLRCKVIFVTAYSQYAVQAFKCSAVDYLLKPVDPDDLVAAFSKAEEAMAQENLRTKLDVLLHNMTQGSRRIVLTTAESMHVVNVEEVIRCEASDNYTTVFPDRQPQNPGVQDPQGIRVAAAAPQLLPPAPLAPHQPAPPRTLRQTRRRHRHARRQHPARLLPQERTNSCRRSKRCNPTRY